MALTLTIMLDNKWVTPWKPSGNRMMKRGFYQSNHWIAARNGLPGRQASTPSALRPVDDIDLVATDLSVRGRLDGLVETFAIGWPRSKLVRPQGYGMEPPFRRMRPPHEAIVEMRTEHTRTFGFFARMDLFVAWRLDLADNTHKHPQLYEAHAEAVMKVVGKMSSSDIDAIAHIDDLIGEFLDD